MSLKNLIKVGNYYNLKYSFNKKANPIIDVPESYSSRSQDTQNFFNFWKSSFDRTCEELKMHVENLPYEKAEEIKEYVRGILNFQKALEKNIAEQKLSKRMLERELPKLSRNLLELSYFVSEDVSDSITNLNSNTELLKMQFERGMELPRVLTRKDELAEDRSRMEAFLNRNSSGISKMFNKHANDEEWMPKNEEFIIFVDGDGDPESSQTIVKHIDWQYPYVIYPPKYIESQTGYLPENYSVYATFRGGSEIHTSKSETYEEALKAAKKGLRSDIERTKL